MHRWLSAVIACALMFSLVGWLGGVAAAASFDCKKAKSKVDKLICATPELSKADDELGGLYQEALAALETFFKKAAAAEQKALRTSQGFWLRRVRNGCADAACMLAAYQQRNAELRAAARPSGRTGSYSDADGNAVYVIEVAPGQLRVSVHAQRMTPAGEVNQGELCAAVTLDKKGKGVFTGEKADECELRFAFAKDKLEVEQEGSCPDWFGAGVVAAASYRRDSKAAPAMELCYEYASAKVWTKSGEAAN